MPHFTPHVKRVDHLQPNILDRNFANDANDLLEEKSREIVALGTEYQKSKDDMSMAMKTLQTKIEKLESENSQLQSTVYKLQDKNLVWLSIKPLNKIPINDLRDNFIFSFFRQWKHTSTNFPQCKRWKD